MYIIGTVLVTERSNLGTYLHSLLSESLCLACNFNVGVLLYISEYQELRENGKNTNLILQ